jgi:[1-hydroxy-2-(trimethylamino)ethyl]phosphonate dioxygenase
MNEPTLPRSIHPATAEVSRLFTERGYSQYGGEAVSQLEHALQAAMFAERDQASPELICAALLHDIGHLLHNLPNDAPETGIDDVHESLGGRWAVRWFGPAVVRPLALHVSAKRYLCATDPAYYQRLSEPSVLSLRLQGGPMSPDEVNAFEADPYFADAVRLRHWDEAAKVVDLETPPLDHFLNYVEKVAGRPR